jgi:hypothetical protein
MKCLLKSKPSPCALLLLIVQSIPAVAQECSLAKTNHTCTLTIDRRHPLTPPTIQMYPGQRLTVLVQHPYYFERYFLDYSSGQVSLAPDVASSIVNGMLGPLAKLGFEAKPEAAAKTAAIPPAESETCSLDNIVSKSPATGPDIVTVAPFYKRCLAEFAQDAKQIYRDLESEAAPDSHSHEAVPLPADNSKIHEKLENLIEPISTAAAKEFQLSQSIGAAKADPNNRAQRVALQELSALISLADPVAKDLFGYARRIADLPALDHGQTSCDDPTEKSEDPSGNLGCVPLFPLHDPGSAYGHLVTRQVTYAVNALNLVSNSQDGIAAAASKVTLASITVFYGDSRWEGSAGTFFSTLPIRSFSAAPVLTSGMVTDNQVKESILYPTVVPFAAANFRLSNDLGRPRWRSAWYWTFAAGINPNTVSADFASGPSISWRGLMFSALWHYGHDVRLTQGLYKGESLGASFTGTATTENYWKNSFAIGVAVRVPSLSGR